MKNIKIYRSLRKRTQIIEIKVIVVARQNLMQEY